jgi:hypothetical protein
VVLLRKLTLIDMKNSIFNIPQKEIEDLYENMMDSYVMFLKVNPKYNNEEPIYTDKGKNLKKEKEFLKLLYPLICPKKAEKKDYERIFFNNGKNEIATFCRSYTVLYANQTLPSHLGKSIILNLKDYSILYIKNNFSAKFSFWPSLEELFNSNNFPLEVKEKIMLNYEKEILENNLNETKLISKKVKL